MRIGRRRLVLATIASVIALGLGPGTASSATTLRAAAAAAEPPAAVSQGPKVRAQARRQARLLERLLGHMIRELSVRRGAGDDQVFDGHEWLSDDVRCWPCNLGPGVAAAVMWRRSKIDRARNGRLATATFDSLLARRQRDDGSFQPAPATGDLTTVFAGVDLATATLELKPLLTRAQFARWRAALIRAADYVYGKLGNFYVNGNINVAVAALMSLTARATGELRFRGYAEQATKFALEPPQPRWAGFGLQFTVTPQRADASDGAAYFAEKGAGAPGFDAEYTTLQAMFVTRLYELAPSGRARRLMNLLFNALRPRIDATTFQLRTDAGTRHPQLNRKVPFLSPILPALAFQAGRTSLLKLVSKQYARIDREMRQSLTYSYGNMYRALGAEVATALQAARPRSTSGS